MTPALLAGMGLGFSLIVAIGAQNLFVLRQGIRRQHALAVALVCAGSDAILIVVGVSGIGWLSTVAPGLVGVVRWAGFAFLLGYAALAAWRAIRPSGAALAADENSLTAGGNGADASPPSAGASVATRTRLAPVLLTCLALTWLNPHVYLDTVFLLGSVATTFGVDRWWFAAGAVLASLVWFFSLAFGARILGRWLRSPRAWRILDGIIAVVMVMLAIGLVLP